jgi:hypothetical protein
VNNRYTNSKVYLLSVDEVKEKEKMRNEGRKKDREKED